MLLEFEPCILEISEQYFEWFAITTLLFSIVPNVDIRWLSAFIC